MSPIRAIITDVDGVMVGKQYGVNFPLPDKEVINSLKQLSAAGVPIILCTAKFGNAIKEIALQAQLNNPHITDGGAVINNWFENKVIKNHKIEKEVAKEYVQKCIEKNIYTEIYTVDNYYIQKSQQCSFTQDRVDVLQEDPIIKESLLDVLDSNEIIKIISFSKDENDIELLQDNVSLFNEKINYIWSQHPYLVPHRILVITAPNVSKQSAAREVAEYLDISLDSILGIGDSEADWSFMELCGYVATIGDDGGDLKELTKTKGEGHYVNAASVDYDGLIAALKHFDLIE